MTLRYSPNNTIATRARFSAQLIGKGNTPPPQQFGPEHMKRPYMMYESVRQSRIIDIYISDAIDEPIEYTDLIQTIRMAGPEDVIYVHINCPGGQLDTGIQIINALRTTDAHVVTELEGVGHSMAALMFLSGKELIVHENTQLMFHTYSGGVLGKGSEIRGQTDATEDWFKVMAYDICYPFMTKREIARMLKGEDFWFQYSAIETRIKRMVQILTQEAEIVATAAEEQTNSDFDRVIADCLQEKADGASNEDERKKYIAVLKHLRSNDPEFDDIEQDDDITMDTVDVDVIPNELADKEEA